MASRHLAAIVAAALSAVLVAGVGLAAGSDDPETATGPSSTTTTTVERSTTTTTEAESTTTSSAPETTTTTAAGESTTTSAAPATTSTTRATSPTTRPSNTTAAPTTATTTPAPPRFEVAAGPDPENVAGCGGVSQVTIRNRGGQIGRFSLDPNQPSWVIITVPQLTLGPGGEVTARIQVADDKNGAASFQVDIVNGLTGQVDGAFAIGIDRVPGLDSNCQPTG